MKGKMTKKANAAVLLDWTEGFAFSLERMNGPRDVPRPE